MKDWSKLEIKDTCNVMIDTKYRGKQVKLIACYSKSHGFQYWAESPDLNLGTPYTNTHTGHLSPLMEQIDEVLNNRPKTVSEVASFISNHCIDPEFDVNEDAVKTLMSLLGVELQDKEC